MKYLSIALILCMLCFSNNLFAAVEIDINSNLQNISNKVGIGLDQPQLIQSNEINFGYFSGEKWIQFEIKNISQVDLSPILFFDSITGTLDIYEKKQNLELVNHFGSSVSADNQLQPKIDSMYSATQIKLKAAESKTYAIKIKSRHNFKTDLYLGNIQQLKDFESEKNSFFLFYIGCIFSLIIYNLFIYLYLKDKNYLRYCLFSFLFLTTLSIIKGYLDRFFSMGLFTFSNYLIIFSSLTLLSATRFTFYFLETFKAEKWIKNVFDLISILCLFLVIIGLTPIEDMWPQIFGTGIDILLILSNLFFIYVAVIQFKKVSTARFFIFSWALIIVALLIFFSMMFGLVESNFFTRNSLLFANIAQMLTLSMALAYRIHTLIHEKSLAEEKAFQKESYQRLVRVLSHDIANSLTVIYSNVERLIAHAFNSDEKIQQAQGKILFAAQNIKNILVSVREQETFNTNQISKMKIQKFQVREVLNECKLLFEEQLNAKKIEFTIQVSSALQIKADRTTFLNNIVNNIISNSIKFTHDFGKISIHSENDKQNTYIIFSDDGVGIQSHLINEIFFTKKLVTTAGTQAEKGTGFGASLVHDYVKFFGGTLEITSKTKSADSSESGTTVKISFPLVD